MTIRSMKVNYSPSIPTTINCNLITYHEPDITDVPVPGTQALNVALAHNKATQHAANVNRTIQTSCPRDKLWTSEGSDNRLDAFGRIVCVQRQDPVNFGGDTLPAGTPLGDLVMEIDVMFESPNLEIEPASEPPTPMIARRVENVATGQSLVLDVDEVACLVEYAFIDPASTATLTMDSPGLNIAEILTYTPSALADSLVDMEDIVGPVETTFTGVNVRPKDGTASYRFFVYTATTA